MHLMENNVIFGTLFYLSCQLVKVSLIDVHDPSPM